MKLARIVVFMLSLLLMAGGYLVSIARFFDGSTKEYIENLDSSPVPMISLVLLLIAIILSFVPNDPLVKEGEVQS